jgi:type I restriction enzyme M protein
VLTNPPFGSKIPVTGEDKLKQYDLAHKWKNKKGTNEWEKGKLADKEAPQILFIERCLQLLKEGGRMAIVLPDGVFGNNQLGYIRKYIMERARLVAVIDIPLETFMPNTGTKTSILIAQKTKDIPEDYPVFMCIAETCGHDRRGNIKEEDDIANIASEFKKWAQENNFSF